MIIATSQLDLVSLEYLQHIEETRGEGSNGVYARAPERTGPRAGWVSRCFFGLAALGVVAWLGQPSFLEGHDFFSVVTTQVGLTALGALLLVLGLRRRLANPLIGSFIYVDALHAWEVGPLKLEAINLEELLSVDGYHHHLSDGSHTFSEVVLHLPSGDHELLLDDVATAERLVRFASLLVGLPDAANEELRVRVQSSRAMLGAVAIRLADDVPIEDLDRLPEGPPLPRPEVSVALAAAESGLRRRWAVPGVVAVVAAAVALAVFPLVDRYRLDEYSWELAKEQADKRHKASRLRRYLADPGNQRHRDEARAMMNSFYDQALKDLKDRRANHDDPQHPIDEQMFAAVLELIESLRKVDLPVVTVGFRATQEPDPVRAEQKLLEKAIYDMRLKEHPELEKIAKASPDGTAILARGQTFDAKQTRLREDVILDRLRSSVQKALGADILTLERGTDGDKPILEVGYHVYAHGGLYLYVSGPADGPNKKDRAKGLIRGYAIDWTITIRPPGSTREHVCKLESGSAQNLNYDSEEGDPDWAPYAIVLYSAFDDMSSRLVRNFALPPPKTQDHYRFKAVTQTDDDR